MNQWIDLFWFPFSHFCINNFLDDLLVSADLDWWLEIQFTSFNFRSFSDINECTLGTHGCSREGEMCINVLGGYRCTCMVGYERDSFNGACIGKSGYW